MKELKVYDNGGTTCDRYLVIIKSDYTDAWNMSSNADAPNGVCMYVYEYELSISGKEVNFKNLPHGVKNKIIELLLD